MAEVETTSALTTAPGLMAPVVEPTDGLSGIDLAPIIIGSPRWTGGPR